MVVVTRRLDLGGGESFHSYRDLRGLMTRDVHLVLGVVSLLAKQSDQKTTPWFATGGWAIGPQRTTKLPAKEEKVHKNTPSRTTGAHKLF